MSLGESQVHPNEGLLFLKIGQSMTVKTEENVEILKTIRQTKYCT